MLRDDAFIVVQSFMVRDLHLKGNELLVYAVIHGFSITESQSFTGSLKYLMEWTGSTSKSNTIKILKSLIDKGLIEKEDVVVNGVKFCKYRATVVLKTNEGGTEIEPRGFENSTEGGSKIEPNNIEVNSNINNLSKRKNTKKESFVPPTLEEVQAYVEERGLHIDPEFFFNYFEAGDWIDSKGHPVKSWKQKLLTWETLGYREHAESDNSSNYGEVL